MPNIDEYYPAGLLKSDDLKGDTQLTIVKVEPEIIGEDKKLVVSFDETDSRLALNKTNANRIADIAKTRDYTQWMGTVITLYTVMTTYKNKEVPAIRVKVPGQ